MSRTQRGSKGAGYDYWSKRPFSGRGYGPAVKKFCHKAERMQEKEEIIKEISADKRDFNREISFIANLLGISESRVNINAGHPVGEDLILVDGKYNGYLDTDFYNYMLHGIDPYADYEDWLINFQENY